MWNGADIEPTIIDKLVRHPNMQLTTMEDIGGVRAILKSQEQVDAIVEVCVASRGGRSAALASMLMAAGRGPGMTATVPCT